MRIGMQLLPTGAGVHGNQFDTTLALARACEDAGLDSVFMADHFMFPDEDDPAREVPVQECFVTLAAIAASTTRIRIGELVVGAPYRNPALLAKMCATLDVVSHGRSIVGLGAAWHEPEFTAYGWPFPALRERMELLEDTVQIVDRMLRQSPASFLGKHHQIENAYNDPQPVQKPRPPILIGGSGERVTLRLVAQYADYSNVGGDPARVGQLFDVLRQHCEAVGRPFEEITRCNNLSVLIAAEEGELAAKLERHPGFSGVAGTPEVVLAKLCEYAAVGSQYVTFTLADAEDIGAVQLLGQEVVPHLAEI